MPDLLPDETGGKWKKKLAGILCDFIAMSKPDFDIDKYEPDYNRLRAYDTGQPGLRHSRPDGEIAFYEYLDYLKDQGKVSEIFVNWCSSTDPCEFLGDELKSARGTNDFYRYINALESLGYKNPSGAGDAYKALAGVLKAKNTYSSMFSKHEVNVFSEPERHAAAVAIVHIEPYLSEKYGMPKMVADLTVSGQMNYYNKIRNKMQDAAERSWGGFSTHSIPMNVHYYLNMLNDKYAGPKKWREAVIALGELGSNPKTHPADKREIAAALKDYVKKDLDPLQSEAHVKTAAVRAYVKVAGVNSVPTLAAKVRANREDQMLVRFELAMLSTFKTKEAIDAVQYNFETNEDCEGYDSLAVSALRRQLGRAEAKKYFIKVMENPNIHPLRRVLAAGALAYNIDEESKLAMGNVLNDMKITYPYGNLWRKDLKNSLGQYMHGSNKDEYSETLNESLECAEINL